MCPTDLHEMTECPLCQGSGLNGPQDDTCPMCEGIGAVTIAEAEEFDEHLG